MCVYVQGLILGLVSYELVTVIIIALNIKLFGLVSYMLVKSDCYYYI